MSQTTSWTLDPVHSDITFSIRHLGISTVRGHLKAASGSASFDTTDPNSLNLNVEIDANTLSTGNDQRDEHVKSADFLDTAKFPTITFSVTGVESHGPEAQKITGDLTLKGVTKPVVLEVEGPSAETTDPYGNVKIGASATTVINRKDFGISFHGVLDSGALLLGEDIKVALDVQFTKQA